MQRHQKVFWSIFLGFVAVAVILIMNIDTERPPGASTSTAPAESTLTERPAVPESTSAETEAIVAAESTGAPRAAAAKEPGKTEPESQPGTPRRISPEQPRQPQWDAEAIQRVVASHKAAIQDCYRQELKKTPSLRGRVIVRITIHPDGYVTRAEIVGASLRDRAVLDCILSKIRQWSDFDPVEPSQGEITIRQSYSFGT